MTVEFQEWPKTARLFRDVVVTEKIDGTNAAIRFEEEEEGAQTDLFSFATVVHVVPKMDGQREDIYRVGAQSRKRLITPDEDNYGFARWVSENAESLFDDLGPGLHFGEWWGAGIQRRYGLDHKRFSLFNTAKWKDSSFITPNLHVVPVLYEGIFSQDDIDAIAWKLRKEGSTAAPGYPDPEGVCIYHTQTRSVFKYTLDGDGHKEIS